MRSHLQFKKENTLHHSSSLLSIKSSPSGSLLSSGVATLLLGSGIVSGDDNSVDAGVSAEPSIRSTSNTSPSRYGIGLKAVLPYPV